MCPPCISGNISWCRRIMGTRTPAWNFRNSSSPISRTGLNLLSVSSRSFAGSSARFQHTCASVSALCACSAEPSVASSRGCAYSRNASAIAPMGIPSPRGHWVRRGCAPFVVPSPNAGITGGWSWRGPGSAGPLRTLLRSAARAVTGPPGRCMPWLEPIRPFRHTGSRHPPPRSRDPGSRYPILQRSPKVGCRIHSRCSRSPPSCSSTNVQSVLHQPSHGGKPPRCPQLALYTRLREVKCLRNAGREGRPAPPVMPALGRLGEGLLPRVTET